MKNISILGSTGSIGQQTLDVIRDSKDYNVVGLTAKTNINLLEKQALEFKPKYIAVYNEKKAVELRERLKAYNIKVVSGLDGLINTATERSADIVLNAVVGMIGLIPTLEAIKQGTTIALANKETLVTAGKLVMNTAYHHKVDILPVDSEHSAIFQALKSGNKEEISKLILTASGGPFRGRKRSELDYVTYKDALNHPNWSMGRKISVDSSTLMNKGLEVIEAKWLFNVDAEMIKVVVHPQSIVHSMVEYVDGSVIAQLGVTDMRIPIQYTLSYPKREGNKLKKLDLIDVGKLTFESPDLNTFPCLKLAIEALNEEGTMPAVLNGANEVVVELFLKEKIGFYDIPRLIKQTMEKHKNIMNPTLKQILESDQWARNQVLVEL